MKISQYWRPNSWKNKKCRQPIFYPNKELLLTVLDQIKKKSALVSATEIKKLHKKLALAQQGKAFILQAGDCAEAFSECNPYNLQIKLNNFQQISQQLQSLIKQEVVLIGRIAGQFAKPRTTLSETYNKVTLPAYRGDLINDIHFNAQARTANPLRLLIGYQLAKNTLNWFLQQNFNIFTSHEALHLDYETALTKKLQPNESKYYEYYNSSCHLPWLGVRTTYLNEAHVTYMQGIFNPIAIKVGINLSPEYLVKLIKDLNPYNLPTKVILITRFGCHNVDAVLPAFIKKIQQEKLKVIWFCDPMHGNTKRTKYDYKTRCFVDILNEVSQVIKIHHQHQSHLAGIHFENSGENVSECIDNMTEFNKNNLFGNYKSFLDPRLNKRQTIKFIHYLAELITNQNTMIKYG